MLLSMNASLSGRGVYTSSRRTESGVDMTANAYTFVLHRSLAARLASLKTISRMAAPAIAESTYPKYLGNHATE